MDARTLLSYSERLQVIGERYNDLFESQLETIKREHGIDLNRKLAQELEARSEEGRLMNIGFVGRVKAGKSSLLNALFFDGKTVLPKAATPMTAALTTLNYGESFAAEVEFFSEEDLQDIRNLAGQYDKQLQQARAQHTVTITRRYQDSGKEIVDEEIRKSAERMAASEMKRVPSLAAAREQLDLMNASAVEMSSVTGISRLAADSPEALVNQLKSFVGAGGAHMPYTKIVNVYMPRESLKDIRVIDTPGTNDPVLSREARTVDLLKSCDVVFVISPAGQFLNEDDLGLIGRITLKEGVQEIALVASQVDAQLHDSEKRARLDDAINCVRDGLASQAKHKLESMKQSNGEAAGVFQALLTSMQNGVLFSAGMCLTLENELANPTEMWGDEEINAWENLVESYPDYFSLSNPELSRVNLAKLSNIPAIQARLTDVRSRKQAITEQRVAALLRSKAEGLKAYRQALSGIAHKQIALVRGADIDDLQTQLKTLHGRQERLKYEVDMAYEECLHDYRTQLRERLIRSVQSALRESEEKVSKADGVKTWSARIEKAGLGNWFARKLWDGGRATEQHSEQTVLTTQVSSALGAFVADLKQLLSTASATARRELDKQLSKQLTPVIRGVMDDDNNSELIFRTIVSVVNALDTKGFSPDLSVSRKLQSRGTLKGHEAVTYLEHVQDFVADLSNLARIQVERYLARLEHDLPKTISGPIVKNLDEQIRVLENQVANAAQTIDRLELMLRELEGVTS